ncbi:ABC transporter substrate-binding protein [Pseudooceanicola sp. HF7]|uniref:ABC transporter substrate-binding protein n=1 Tax=Pseudooceanicola sp. HF7 TaxID=2721560 RepID=UPI001431424B|nr:ABC transporter substrate-binding protein [Pseudooceanicola sp. HF7]NIZ11363.1 ABC transporter substrate-binding protein [Pseudooceanicola sp. HF7]
MNGHFQKDQALLLAEKFKSGRINRRSFVQGLGMLAGASALGLNAATAKADTKEMIYVNWGGDAIDAMAEAFGDSFTEETGITILYDGSGPTEGAIKAQAEGGSPTWDLVDCDPFSGQALGRQGLMEPIDWSIVDEGKLREGFKWEYAASSYFYSYVIAYDKTVYDTPPTSMADFFDTEKFPGKRSMYKWGVGMWEAALLADGVAPEDLYPLDMERAHAKIAAFKDNVGAFWGGGAESQSLLLNGDVSMALIWSTRAMLLDKDTDGDIAMTWAEGIIAPGSNGVIKNNPGGAEAAMQYIASTQDPEKQVVLFEMLGNGPANPAADALIPDEEKFYNPVDPENYAQQIPLDMDWYEENYGAALDEYLGIISS